MDLASSLQEENRLNRPGYSFTEAIRISEELLAKLEECDFPSSQTKERIVSLISSLPGARGFFVSYLTGNFACSDEPPLELIEALTESPLPSLDLLVRNLVMSTAMAITHDRNGDAEAAKGSRLVAVRTKRLIGRLSLAELQEKIAQMRSTIQEGQGQYADFLKQWGYDRQQLAAAQEALESALAG
jgi:hypothetical protein